MLYADASDPAAELFYASYAKLLDASEGERAGLSEVYQAILGMAKATSTRVKAAVAEVGSRCQPSLSRPPAPACSHPSKVLPGTFHSQCCAFWWQRGAAAGRNNRQLICFSVLRC